MSAETEAGELDHESTFEQFAIGAVGGVLGALLFGIFIQFATTDFAVAIAVPGVYGLEGPLPVAAWGKHLFHGALLGLIYR